MNIKHFISLNILIVLAGVSSCWGAATQQTENQTFINLQLQYAAVAGNLQQVTQALTEGAEVNVPNKFGNTALSMALRPVQSFIDNNNKKAKIKYKSVVEKLIQAGANTDGELRNAIENKNKKMIRFLIKCGANISSLSDNEREKLSQLVTVGG